MEGLWEHCKYHLAEHRGQDLGAFGLSKTKITFTSPVQDSTTRNKIGRMLTEPTALNLGSFYFVKATTVQKVWV